MVKARSFESNLLGLEEQAFLRVQTQVGVDETSLPLRLMLDVHDKKRALALESGFDHEVGLSRFVGGEVTQQFNPCEATQANSLSLVAEGRGTK